MSNYDMIIIRGGSMASRMDRYRNQEVEPTGMRTKRNEHLYAKVDAPLEYSSVEGVARIDNTSSVDINKIKELTHFNIEDGNERFLIQLYFKLVEYQKGSWLN